MKSLVLFNSGAGRATTLETLREELAREELEWLELKPEIQLHQQLAEAVDGGVRRVIAAGGDGTVNAAVNGIMQLTKEQRPLLAVLPLGTANDFACSLGVSQPPLRFDQFLRASRPVAIDVVRTRGNQSSGYYANVAAGGNSVRVSEHLTEEIKTRWGAYCYLRGAIDVLGDMRSFQVSVDVDGERLENLDCWAVLVANGRTTGGRISVAPAALLDDGKLDLVLIREGTTIDLIEIAANNLLSSYLDCEQVEFRQAERVTLRSEPPMHFTLDGEVCKWEPLSFEIVPGAIEMLAGPEAATTAQNRPQ